VYVINNNRDDLKKSIEYIKNNDLSKEPVFKKTYEESNLYYKAYSDSCTIKKTVDGGGNYSIQVQPGDYTVIIESNGRLLMKKVLITTVKSKEVSNVDCRFGLN
jgi:flagellar hook assembly protein FlgD